MQLEGSRLRFPEASRDAFGRRKQRPPSSRRSASGAEQTLYERAALYISGRVRKALLVHLAAYNLIRALMQRAYLPLPQSRSTW